LPATGLADPVLHEAGSAAGLTILRALNRHGSATAPGGLLQLEAQVGLDVAARDRMARATLAPLATEETGKEVAVGGAIPAAKVSVFAPPVGRPFRGLREITPRPPVRAELVVASPLVRVGQHRVRLVDRLERLLRLRPRLTLMQVRMVLPG
jgi:hypothetical protein